MNILKSFKDLLVYMSVCFIVIIFCSIICTILDINNTISNILIKLLIVIVSVILLKSKNHRLFIFLKFNPLTRKNILLILAYSIPLTFTIHTLVNFLAQFFPCYVAHIDSSDTTVILTFLSTVLISPITEEIFFRGILYNKLKNNLNVLLATFIQAIIFGLVHGNILHIIYATILGVIFSFIYDFFNSILAPILMHITLNFLGTFAISLVSKFISSNVYTLICAASIILTITLPIYIYYNFRNQFSMHN